MIRFCLLPLLGLLVFFVCTVDTDYDTGLDGYHLTSPDGPANGHFLHSRR